MLDIMIEKNPKPETLNALGVFNWSIWSHEAAEFPWIYDSTEQCYILEGKATITTQEGNTVEIEKGHLVTFPQGLNCTWLIHQAIKKHYKFL